MLFKKKTIWAGGTEPPEPRQFRASEYPRIYTSSSKHKAGMLVVGLLVVPALLFFVLTLFNAVRAQDGAYMAIVVAGLVALLATGVFGSLLPYFSTLTLHADAIERSSLFGSRRIHRDQIQSWRLRMVKNTKYIDLAVSGEARDKWSIMLTVEPDAAFEAWFYDLPNGDLQERKQSEEDIRQDVTLGDTPEERLASVTSATKRQPFLYVALFIGLFWVYVFPSVGSSYLLLLVAAPWLAVLLAWSGRGMYTVGKPNKNSLRPDLAFLMLGPTIVLAMRAALDLRLLDWTQALLPGFTLGLVLTLFLWVAVPRFAGGGRKLLCATLAATAYATASLMLANTALDHASAVQYPVTILEKYRTTGKGAKSYFVISPWSGNAAPARIVPPPDLYNSKSLNEQVCIFQHAGALRMPWQELGECTSN
jgi:hypothetical protein